MRDDKRSDWAAPPGRRDVKWRVSVDVSGARAGAGVEEHLGGVKQRESEPK
jgi:hypothetical protein